MANVFCYACSQYQEQKDIATDIIQAVEGMEDVNDLIMYNDQLINEIGRGCQEQVGRPNSVATSITSGGNLIEKLSKRLNWHVFKKCLLSALDRQTRKLVIEVLNQTQIIQLVGMVLSIIASQLEREASSNKIERLHLLRYMSTLAKHMRNLNIHLERRKLGDILRFTVKAAVICAMQMNPKSLRRFICVPLDAADLENLKSELVYLYPDLGFQAQSELSNMLDAVGIEKSQDEVIKLLNLTESSRRAVVIYGIGGIGKTTLATAVFNRLDLTDYHYCRVDLDQDSKASDLQIKQEQMLRDLFKENLKLNNFTEGREKLREAFGKASKPLFLFIDNALRQTDLEMLLPTEHLSGLPMLRKILVTTRNLNETNMFRPHDGIQIYSYRVDALSEGKAKRLLCHYALGHNNGRFGSRVNIYGLLEICGGIPLVLRTVGSKLNSDGNTELVCNDILQSNNILEYLKTWQDNVFEGGEEDIAECMVDFVYKQLREPSQEAFLDIVFFFCDWDRSKVRDIVGEMQLEDLEGAALVSTSEGGKVKIHDLVRAIGRKMSNGTRIADKESLCILLNDVQKIQQTKGIWLSNYDDGDISLRAKDVDIMSRSLRVLYLGNRITLSGRCEREFKELRFLHTSNVSCVDILPTDTRKSKQLAFLHGQIMEEHRISKAKLTINLPESLRFLYLDGGWDSFVWLTIDGNLTSLRELELIRIDFENFENSIKHGNFSYLRILKLTNCNLDRLPENFGNLSSLQTLNMYDCSNLERLPESFCNLYSLQTLIMELYNSNSKLDRLPKSFGNLCSLKTLSMYSCSNLERLPESFGSLSSLQTLSMNRCSSLEEFPESFGNLCSLKTLIMYSCSNLERLPESFGSLCSLQVLSMDGCSNLKRLSDSFGNLSSLQILRMDDCSSLEEFPESFGNLSSLERIRMDKCSSLKRLPDSFGNLSSLEVLSAYGCYNLESLPDSFGNLSSLQTLSMYSCSKLKGLPENFGNLSSLQTLSMNRCSDLERLPQSFGNLSSLEILCMDGCEKMCILYDNFGQLTCLKYLSIRNCKKLKRLPDDILLSTTLVAMKAYGCAELEAYSMDSLVEIRSLMFVEMGESPMLIKRWEEIHKYGPLLGAALRFKRDNYPYEEIMSTIFFSGGSRFLHLDGNGRLEQVASSSFPEAGVKVGLLFRAGPLSDELRKKLLEVASQELQIIYVDTDVGVEWESEGSSGIEEREKRIRKTLLELPEGCRAWSSHFYKTRLLFAYSLWRFTALINGETEWFEPFIGTVGMSLVGTSVVVDEEGRRQLSHPLEMIFQSSELYHVRNLSCHLLPLTEACNWMLGDGSVVGGRSENSVASSLSESPMASRQSDYGIMNEPSECISISSEPLAESSPDVPADLDKYSQTKATKSVSDEPYPEWWKRSDTEATKGISEISEASP